MHGKLPRGRPRVTLCDFISDLAWASHGMKPAELLETAVDHGVFRTLVELLPLQQNLTRGKAGEKTNKNVLKFYYCVHSSKKITYQRLKNCEI